MTPELSRQWRLRLEDHVRIWQVDPVGHTDVLVAVAATVPPELVSPALDGLRHADSVSRTRLAAMVTELANALDLVSLGGVAAQDAAVAAMARRLLADEVTPRELTYWVTRVVGLRGGLGAQRFLELEQEYCDRPGEGGTDLDGRVRDAARDLLSTASRGDADLGRRGIFARLGRRTGRRSR